MKNRKRLFCLLTLALLSFALLAGCGDGGCGDGGFGGDITGGLTGADWRTTGVVRDGGTITRNGEDTVVLVCIHKADATFYYDSEDQTLFDFVDYPITFGSNVWEAFKGIDFADLNGDGDSDVTMRFDDGSSEIVLVWYWNAESAAFVYQPEESFTGGRRTTEEIYHELLERYYALVSHPDSAMDTTEDGEYGVLEAARGLGEDALNGIGYLIEDLSGDGVPELAVGTLREYGGQVNALYTLADSEPELVFEGWGRNSYTYVDAYAGDSSCFYYHGSSSAAESGLGVFTLSRNGRELDWRGFYFTYAEDGDWDNVTVYTNTTGSWDPAESEPADMTLEEYSALLSVPVVESMDDFWGMYCTESGLYLTPFSAWASGSAADPEHRAWVLTGGALPFTNMETLQSETHEDGTYYCENMTEDGLTVVVNTALPRDFSDDSQPLADYLTDCALSLAETDNCHVQSAQENEAYTKQMTFPVYIVTYTAGGNEDTREWTVFAMETDRYTYLYGFGTTLDAANDMKPVYQDIFAGLHLSDGE